MQIGQIAEVSQSLKRNILPAGYLETILKGELFWVSNTAHHQVTLPVGMKLELVGRSTAFKRDERVPVYVYQIVYKQDTHQAKMLGEDYEGWLCLVSEDKQLKFMTEPSAP